MKKRFGILLFIIAITLGLAQSTYAQPRRVQHQDRLGDSLVLKDVAEKEQFKKRVPFRINDFSLGPMMLSDGYGAIFSFGRAFGFDAYGRGNEEKYYNSHVIQIELSERRHPKEYSPFNYAALLGLFSSNGGSYKYGKVNNVYNAKLSYTQRRLFGGRGEANSPLVQFFVGGGASLAILKPYYVSVFGGSYVKYDSTTQNGFLYKDGIIGKAPFTEGLSELDMIMGINLKGGIYYDFAKNKKRISAVEVGVGLDYYFDPIAQMALLDPKSTFFNVYINYQFGKRW